MGYCSSCLISCKGFLEPIDGRSQHSLKAFHNSNLSMGNFRHLTLSIATTFEFFLAITLLGLFSCAYPDRFRTRLWQDGGLNGWNSNPSLRVYYYANYREPPPIPMIWDESSTRCNLCIAIITVIVWVARFSIRGRGLDVFSLVIVNALYDLLLVAMWAYSAIVQSSGDFTDLERISFHPWYLERGCEKARWQSRRACEVVAASYGLSVLATWWFGIRFLATCMCGAYHLGLEQKEASICSFP
ncbi:hypothetical protein K505DRAFT_329629 [Melanomma pulvis-pyrius CBS 109.77]|uniref:MARVEL domain-containing protein n=1 Tax=Melanomma pulvis-pyrius CBS 109.77 TaxID=1314802 RepID=A0A6A6WUE1_9PLEO|nr:hypothetical protein K505DRAFT_329629 [Melanomma pulvis-pyrius CBS 109.77]